MFYNSYDSNSINSVSSGQFTWIEEHDNVSEQDLFELCKTLFLHSWSTPQLYANRQEALEQVPPLGGLEMRNGPNLCCTK